MQARIQHVGRVQSLGVRRSKYYSVPCGLSSQTVQNFESEEFSARTELKYNNGSVQVLTIARGDSQSPSFLSGSPVNY